MRFTKTIELWGLETALRSGHLKLQCGQHVTCGGTKGRFIGVRPSGAIWVMYSQPQFFGYLKASKAHQ